MYCRDVFSRWDCFKRRCRCNKCKQQDHWRHCYEMKPCRDRGNRHDHYDRCRPYEHPCQSHRRCRECGREYDY